MLKLKILGILLVVATLFSLWSHPAEATYDQAKAAAFLKTHQLDEWSVMALASSNSLAATPSVLSQNSSSVGVCLSTNLLCGRFLKPGSFDFKYLCAAFAHLSIPASSFSLVLFLS